MPSKSSKRSFFPAAHFQWVLFPLSLVVGAVVTWVLFSLLPLGVPQEEQILSAAAPVTFRHPLTGLPADSRISPPNVYGVMIENSADAWPLSGLERAFLVFEAPAEGNIPRLLVFFGEDVEVERIGPIRSARPYFVEWNDMFSALYAHVGGSPDALDRIETGGTFDLNEFFAGEFFWRSSRARPHNVYTSSALLHEARLASIDEAPDPLYDTWTFCETEESCTQGLPATSVEIAITNADLYDIAWEYDTARQSYTRFQGGEVFEVTGEEQSEPLFFQNIVVLVTDIEVIDEVGRRELATTGSGEALVFHAGHVEQARWSRDSHDMLHFFTPAGEEIAFSPGSTWVEVIDDLDRVDWE